MEPERYITIILFLDDCHGHFKNNRLAYIVKARAVIKKEELQAIEAGIEGVEDKGGYVREIMELYGKKWRYIYRGYEVDARKFIKARNHTVDFEYELLSGNRFKNL